MVNSKTYHTSDLSKDFGVNPMTVRNWAVKFSDHLTDDANPPKGTTRAFTLEDAMVLSLVAQFIKHKSPEEIHARLRNGEVGRFPLITNATLDLPDARREIRQLELQLVDKDQQMAALNTQIIELNAELVEVKNTPNTQIKILEAQLSDRDKQLSELKADIDKMRKELLEVYRLGMHDGMSLVPKPADAAAPAPAEGQGG